jgi:hypothetical protein
MTCPDLSRPVPWDTSNLSRPLPIGEDRLGGHVEGDLSQASPPNRENPTMTMTTCPDCAAVAKFNHLLHEATCPLGLAVDKVSAADAEWFERHPNTNQYRRPITPAEAEELRLNGLMPAECEIQGRILVRQLTPGVRTRSFDKVIAFPRRST